MLLRLLWRLVLALALPASGYADDAATLVFFSGSPVITDANGLVRHPVRGGMIAGGETIDTADGRVQLRFQDGATMSLQPNTQFRIDRFRYSGNGGPAQPGDGVIMSLIKGGLRTVTGWLGRHQRPQYKIGTAVATIGIRGTEFGATLDGSGLVVSTYAGLVEVCSDVGCVDVAPAESVWVRAPGVRPELRRDQTVLDLKREQILPETPTPRDNLPTQSIPSSAPVQTPQTVPLPTVQPTPLQTPSMQPSQQVPTTRDMKPIK